MEGIIFIGIQASGKSTFYKKAFFNSHMRISMDLLNTRNKENQFLDKCIDLQQRVVVDNTNPTKKERQKYIDKFINSKYKILAYYFDSTVNMAIERNENRTGKEKIPDIGIKSTYKKLEPPSFEEGFSEIYYVQISEGGFKVKKMKNEI